MQTPPRLKLYTRHRLEDLAQLFQEEVFAHHEQFRDLAPAVAVVQTSGVGNWLRRELAVRNGVVMNLELPFLASYVNRRLVEIYGITPEEQQSYLNTKQLRWRCFRELLNNTIPSDVVEKYLQGDDSERFIRAWQLSGKTADLLDRYQLTWPTLVECWQKDLKLETNDEHEQWLRKLYNAVFQGGKLHCYGELLQRFISDKDRRTTESGGVISVFGVGAMRHSWFDFFRALAERGWNDVHFFYLSPCAEYWEFQHDPKQRLIESRKDPDYVPELGNPILANNCRQGRLLYNQLLDLDDAKGELTSNYQDSQPTCCLHKLQQDILTLAPKYVPPAGAPDGREDDSVVVHNCHRNPRRQVEILRDQLVRAFKDDKSLKPSDVLVMAPNINAYAPYIRGVFDTAPFAGNFNICDRLPLENGGVINAFMALLKASMGKCTSTELFEILSYPAILQHFQLDGDNQLEQIHSWIEDAGIRWGEDAAHHKQVVQCDFREYSWEYGLKRLFMSYARTDANTLDTDNIAGGIEINGSLPTLARFSRFIRTFFKLRKKLQPQPLNVWPQILGECLEQFFPTNRSTDDELALLRQIIGHISDELSAFPTDSSQPTKAPLPLIIAILQDELSRPAPASSFISNKITFCSLQPMRSIPKKIIAILGLNDEDFPSPPTAVGFDLRTRLTTNNEPNLPAPYDNYTASDESRFLFLETIMAAREKLWLFYGGMSITTKDEFPPSVPLAELIEYLGLTPVRHHLQAFDANYFREGTPDNMRSYNLQAFHIAKSISETTQVTAKQPTQLTKSDAATAEADAATTEADAATAKADAATAIITLRELENFFEHPISAWLRNHTGLKIDEYNDHNVLDEQEALSIGADKLFSANLRKDLLLQLKERDLNIDEWTQRLAAHCRLPVCPIGQADLDEYIEKANTFMANTNDVIGVFKSAEEKQITVVVDKCQVIGSILQVPETTNFLWYVAHKKLRGSWKYAVRFALQRAFLQAALTEGDQGKLYWFDESMEAKTLDLIAHDTAPLQTLLKLYSEGQNSPLVVPPKSACEYIENKNGNHDRRWQKAHKRFTQDQYKKPAECNSPTVKAAGITRKDFENSEIKFQEVAQAILKLLP